MRKLILLCIVGSIFFLTACASCSLDSPGVTVWGGDVTCPKMIRMTVVSGNELVVSFSGKISVQRADVTLIAAASVIPVIWKEGGDINSISFLLKDAISIGRQATLAASVTDIQGNSLSFSVPFVGYNDRVAQLRFNEIRVDYSKPKVEYIELYVLKGGNTGGIEIQNAMNAVRPSYEFPPVEVAAGDYLVYHLRSVEEGLVNETDVLNASAGVDARPGARDFWDTLKSAPLKKTNVLVLRERKEGAIMDALLTAETGKTAWPEDKVKLLAEEAVAAGAWMPGSTVQDAVCSTGTSPTRTLGRNELSLDSGSAADWKICATGKCSPGATNVPH